MCPCLCHYADPLLNPGRDPVYGGCESTRNQIWCHSPRTRALPSVQRLKDLHISMDRTGGTISLTMEALLDSSSVERASEACRRQHPADTSSDRVPNCGSTHERHGCSTRTMSSSKEGGGHRIGNRYCPANGIGAMSRDLESTLRRLSELVARLKPLTQSQVTAAPLMHAVPIDHLR